MDIRIASLDDAAVRTLVTLHQRRAYEASPPGTSFALDLDGLRDPAILVIEARDAEGLLGIGALKALDDRTGEVKSMRTADAALRRGVAQAILSEIEARARGMGLDRLVLETGTGEIFEPANRLYQRNGYVRRGPFGDYAATAFNIFYEKRLG